MADMDMGGEPEEIPGVEVTPDHYIVAGKKKDRTTRIIQAMAGDPLSFMRETNPEGLERSATVGKELHNIAMGVMLAYAGTRQWPTMERLSTARLINRWPMEHLEWASRLIKWAEARVAQVLAVEQFVDGGIYAGTVDLVATMMDGKTAVIDWKTGSPSKTHNVQLSAYVQALKTTMPDLKVKKRVVVYIPAKGGEPKELADLKPKESDAVWESMLKVWEWRGRK